MSIIYDALKKVDQKITPTPRAFPLKRSLLIVALFGLGLLIAKAVFSTVLSPDSIRASLSATSPLAKEQPVPLSQPAPKEPSVPAVTRMAPKETAPFVLNGVFASGEEGYALINNQIVQEGDTIGGAKVVSITGDGVTLESGGETINLKASLHPSH